MAHDQTGMRSRNGYSGASNGLPEVGSSCSVNRLTCVVVVAFVVVVVVYKSY